MTVETLRLGDVCRITIGRTPSRGNSKFWDESKSTRNIWLSIADLADADEFGEVLESNEYLSDVGASLFQAIPAGTLLMSFKLTIGRLAFAGTDLRTNEAIAALIPKNSKQLDKHFLYYQLMSFDWDAIAGEDVKVKGKTLNKKKIADIEILIPELKIQKKIVERVKSLLIEVKNLDNKVQESERVVAELESAVIGEILIAENGAVSKTHTLGQICKVDWGNTSLTKRAFVTDGQHAAVSAAGIDGRIDYAEHKANTPVLSAIGANCGRMFLPEEDFTAIKNTITLTPFEDKVSGPYLFRLLQAIELPKRGAGQPFISKGDIEKFQVSILPIDLQSEAVNKVDSIFGKLKEFRDVNGRKTHVVKELQNSILRTAFTEAVYEVE